MNSKAGTLNIGCVLLSLGDLKKSQCSGDISNLLYKIAGWDPGVSFSPTP